MSTEVISPVSDMRLPDEFGRLRAGLLAHCYQMTGSYQDAEDLVQETYLRAMRGITGFQARSSLKTWLYRIATNTCITALHHRSRRVLPAGLGPPTTDPDTPIHADHTIPWLQPLPDAALTPDHDPSEIVIRRETLRLALVAALQHLPARQRAAFLLREVLSWTAADIADTLDITIPAVKSLLQRARKRLTDLNLTDHTLTDHPPTPPDHELEATLLNRYITAFHTGDTTALRAVIHDDFTLQAVPHPVWFHGIHVCLPFLQRRAFHTGTRLLPTRANNQPALASYRPHPTGQLHASGLWVLHITNNRFSHAINFHNPHLVTAAGLPDRLTT